MGNKLKRKSIFHYLKDKGLDIIFLKETHSTGKSLKLWKTEWNGEWIGSSGVANARGTAILINKKCDIQIDCTRIDHEGRINLLNFSKDNIKYTVCNLYAPNEDNPNFFKRVFKMLDKHGQENVIVGGDFNLVLNTEMDRLNSQYNNKQAAEYINNVISEGHLCDIWRDRNPDSKRYTWFRKGRGNGDINASRIDMFLVNNGMAGQIEGIDFCTSTRTDHSLFSMSIVNQEFPRGPGMRTVESIPILRKLWKLWHMLIETIQELW